MIVLNKIESEALSAALKSTGAFFDKASEIIDQWSKSPFEEGGYEQTCFLTVRQTISTSLMIREAVSKLDDFTAQQLLRALFVLHHDLVFLIMPSQEKIRQYHFRLFKTHGFMKAQSLLNKVLKDKPEAEQTDNDNRFRLKANSEASLVLSEFPALLEIDGLGSTSPNALARNICNKMEEIRACYLDSERVDIDFQELVHSTVGVETTEGIRDHLTDTLQKHDNKDSGLWYSITSTYSHPSFAALHIGLPERIVSLAASLRWALNLTHASIFGAYSRLYGMKNLYADDLQQLYDKAVRAIEACIPIKTIG